MRLKKENYNFLKINICNLILFICLLISSRISDLKWLFYLIFIFIFIIYLLKQSDITIVKHQISYIFISYSILDFLFYFKIINASMELKYITDIISIVLLFKVLINFYKYKCIIKDSFFIIIF